MLGRLAQVRPDGRLLDAGGGTGRIAQFLHGQAAQVVVADLSFHMLQEARNKDGLQPVNACTEVMPFPDNTFASIIIVDALHHVADQRQTARELWRVLAPGGRLVIEEPDVRKMGVKLIALAEKMLLMRSHFLAPPRIAGLFRPFYARVQIIRDGSTAWVIVEKDAD